jgi:hypothetical protein
MDASTSPRKFGDVRGQLWPSPVPRPSEQVALDDGGGGADVGALVGAAVGDEGTGIGTGLLVGAGTTTWLSGIGTCTTTGTGAAGFCADVLFDGCVSGRPRVHPFIAIRRQA